jgi:hypothetical protein
VVSKALTCRLYQNQACTWLHLTQALITVKPIALGFTYPFKGSLYHLCPHQMAQDLDILGWSEPAATNAPVEDEAIQVVLGMNRKHILPWPKLLVFSASFLPQSFFLLPISLLLTLTSLPPPTYFTSFCAHSIVRAQEHLKSDPGSVWSKSQDNELETGARTTRFALCPICCTLSGSTGPGTCSGSSIIEYGLLLWLESLMHGWDPSSFCYKHAQTFLWWQVLLHLPQNFVCVRSAGPGCFCHNHTTQQHVNKYKNSR